MPSPDKGRKEEDEEPEVAREDEEQEEEQDGEAGDEELEYEEEEENGDEALDGDEDDEAFEKTGNAPAVAERTMTGQEIVTDSFGELVVDDAGYQAANDVWRLFIKTAESEEAAGEVIYAALFEASPSLQSLFVSPRAVAAMKFLQGLGSFVQALNEPPKLKILVETLGFGHLHLDVTVPRVVIFRDAILDIFAVELGERFNSLARDAWVSLLNYIGGAIIYVKASYGDRIKTLLASWQVARKGSGSNSAENSQGHSEGGTSGDQALKAILQQKKGKSKGFFSSKKEKIRAGGAEEGEVAASTNQKGGEALNASQVPTNYSEMFQFNAAVMGFGNHLWMNEVLDCFDSIVNNVANPQRLQEECDVLVLRIARVTTKGINFGEYKSCMLASLRSLLPKDWSTQHEVAWCWLWENVERILQNNMGNPPKWEKALGRFLAGLDENQAFEFRKSIYNRFFALAPAGQDYFKQSNTYLHFIADRVLQMTLELYKDPVKMCDDISAVGLRHVGYGIATEFLGPFVSASLEIMMTVTQDSVAIEAYRWSLGLMAKMMSRTIHEGSTIVMKAINGNSSKALRKAIGCAPRGERTKWLLTVQVGTQKISPLAWSIESGALESAQAIIADLLTFRADRDRYYYGMDSLFERHPEIVKTLCNDAPSLVPHLLDGLIWRSRTTEGGLRRANYYIRHLLVTPEGKFSPTLSWIAKSKDPRLVCHSVIVLLSETVWNRQAMYAFLWRKSWFLVTLLVFICGQSVVKHVTKDMNTQTECYLIFACRCFIYGPSMSQLIWIHMSKCVRSYRKKDTVALMPLLVIPKYLMTWQATAGLLLMVMLISMLVVEPMIWCLGGTTGDKFADTIQFFETCDEAKDIVFLYSVISMLAMTLYYALLLDLAVLSTKVSAYILVCIRMLSEVLLFILALGAILMAFGSSVSVIKHDQSEFEGLHHSTLNLVKMFFQMFDGQHFDMYESDPLVAVCVFAFMIIAVVFLLNMLVAQLTCAYEAIYGLMVGYARLERIEIIVNTMPNITERRWIEFCSSLRLHEKVEFNSGDIGVTGGLQIVEPANANPTTQDIIKRYGGSTSIDTAWPIDAEGEGDDSEKFDRIESLIQRTFKRMKSGRGGGGGHGGTFSGSGSGTGTHTGSDKDEDPSGGSQ